MSANVNNVLQRFLDTNKTVLDKLEGHHGCDYTTGTGQPEPYTTGHKS